MKKSELYQMGFKVAMNFLFHRYPAGAVRDGFELHLRRHVQLQKLDEATGDIIIDKATREGIVDEEASTAIVDEALAIQSVLRDSHGNQCPPGLCPFQGQCVECLFRWAFDPKTYIAGFVDGEAP